MSAHWRIEAQREAEGRVVTGEPLVERAECGAGGCSREATSSTVGAGPWVVPVCDRHAEPTRLSWDQVAPGDVVDDFAAGWSDDA